MDNAWRSITDEGVESVPVTVTSAEQTTAAQNMPSEKMYVRINPSMNGSMSLAAVSGILLVLLSGATFYIGTDFLRASLTGSLETVSVVMTENGAFAPSQVDVHPGDVLTIENRNANAQLLRSTDAARALFTEQVVLAGETFTYDIPLDTPEGSYVVQSAVLVGQTLTVTVYAERPSSSSGVEESAVDPASSDEFMQNILIPSLNDLGATPTPSMQSSSMTSSASSQRDRQAEQQDQKFMLAQGNQNVFAPFSNVIETNPYTVGNTTKRPLPGSSSKGSLHSGAPLITTHTPRASSQTGPGLWLLSIIVLASMAGVSFGMKKIHL